MEDAFRRGQMVGRHYLRSSCEGPPERWPVERLRKMSAGQSTLRSTVGIVVEDIQLCDQIIDIWNSVSESCQRAGSLDHTASRRSPPMLNQPAQHGARDCLETGKRGRAVAYPQYPSSPQDTLSFTGAVMPLLGFSPDERRLSCGYDGLFLLALVGCA